MEEKKIRPFPIEKVVNMAYADDVYHVAKPNSSA